MYATADALVAPDFKDRGLLDTAVVVITFDNGARAVAEASFSAAYGYDVRAEVFGSAGMVTVGDGARSSLRTFTAAGRRVRHRPRRRRADDRRLHRASSSSSPPPSARAGSPSVTGHDARRALAVALACVESVQAHAPVAVTEAGLGGRRA